MRSRMDQELDNLHQELIIMGSMCETAIKSSIASLITGDLTHAEEAINIDRHIDDKEREIEALCIKFMLRQQPVAKDLRKVSSALKIITDMERIGDQARDIAEITYHVNLKNQLGLDSLKKMAEATINMLIESVNAFVNEDLELANKVIKSDDVVDQYFLDIREQLVNSIRENDNLAENALDFMMIAKYFERIGDHATNIAEWVEFSLTGKRGNDN